MGRVFIACVLLVVMGNFSLNYGSDWKQVAKDTYIDTQSITKSGAQITIIEKQYQIKEHRPEFTFITNMTVDCAESKIRINSYKVLDEHMKVIHAPAESPDFVLIDVYSTDEQIRQRICK